MTPEQISQVFEQSFREKPTKLEVQKNVRLSGRSDVWDINAEYAEDGLKQLYIQLKRKELVVYGLSCTVEVSDKKIIRFDFAFDSTGPVVDVFTSKVSASFFYNRLEDNNRFVINTEIDKVTIADLISKNLNLLVSTFNNVRHIDVAKPGELDMSSATEEERKTVLQMLNEGLEKTKTVLEEVVIFADKIRVDSI